MQNRQVQSKIIICLCLFLMVAFLSSVVFAQQSVVIPSGSQTFTVTSIRGAPLYNATDYSSIAYYVYAVTGANNDWATIVIKNKDGITVAQETLGKGSGKDMRLGFSVKLDQISALQNGTVVGANIIVVAPQATPQPTIIVTIEPTPFQVTPQPSLTNSIQPSPTTNIISPSPSVINNTQTTPIPTIVGCPLTGIVCSSECLDNGKTLNGVYCKRGKWVEATCSCDPIQIMQPSPSREIEIQPEFSPIVTTPTPQLIIQETIAPTPEKPTPVISTKSAGPPNYPECNPILYNGDSGKKLDLVFFGNIPLKSAVEVFASNRGLFSTEPFISLKNKFNIWYIPMQYNFELKSHRQTLVSGSITAKISLKELNEKVKKVWRTIEKPVAQLRDEIVDVIEDTRVGKELLRWGRRFEKNVIRPASESAAKMIMDAVGLQRTYDTDGALKFARSKCPTGDNFVYLQDSDLRKADIERGVPPPAGISYNEKPLAAAVYIKDNNRYCERVTIAKDETLEYCLTSTLGIIKHELGHSIAGLADEYDVASAFPSQYVAALNSIGIEVYGDAGKNCLPQNECYKFRELDTNAGCFNGCGTQELYRPYKESMMRGSFTGGGYGKIHQYYFTQSMEGYDSETEIIAPPG